MDWQNLINLVGGAALAVIGWFARQLWDAVQKLKTDMSKLELSISDNYVKKDDFKDGIKELKDMLGRYLISQTIKQIGDIIDPLTILAALGPLAVDLGKSLIGRFIQTDVYKPTNIGEYTQMRQTDLAMFRR